MAEFDNTNRGVLFRNERKQTDRHPDYTGRININGTEYWLSGWVNEIRNGARAGQNMVSMTIGDPVDAPRPTPADFDKLPF